MQETYPRVWMMASWHSWGLSQHKEWRRTTWVVVVFFSLLLFPPSGLPFTTVIMISFSSYYRFCCWRRVFFLFPRTQLQQSRKRKGNCSNSREELATIRSRNHCLRHVDVSFLSGREGFEFTAQIITCNSAAITPTTPDMSGRLFRKMVWISFGSLAMLLPSILMKKCLYCCMLNLNAIQT